MRKKSMASAVFNITFDCVDAHRVAASLVCYSHAGVRECALPRASTASIGCDDLGIWIYSAKYSTRIGTAALKGCAHSDLEVPKGQQSVTTMAGLPSKMAITSCGEDNLTPGVRHVIQVFVPVSRRPTVAVHSSR
jgi:hypothetical protein